MLHYGIEPSEIEGRLFVDSGREKAITLACQSREGFKTYRAVSNSIVAELKEKKIGLLILDPFVATHRVAENDNGAIDSVVKELAYIADRAKCAIEIVHHSRKTNGAEVTVEDGRGASALLAAVRSGRVLNGMTQGEGSKARVDNPRAYFRVENGKTNLYLPSSAYDWYHLASVALGNHTLERPGDSIGVVESWQWPDAMDSVTAADVAAIQEAVRVGEWRKDPRASDWVGRAIAKAMRLNLAAPLEKSRVQGILKELLESGALREITAPGPDRKSKAFIVAAEPDTVH